MEDAGASRIFSSACDDQYDPGLSPWTCHASNQERGGEGMNLRGAEYPVFARQWSMVVPTAQT